MYILKVLRHGQLKYETDVILDMEIDPVSYSGLDFHNQEARQGSLELLYDGDLERLLEGEERQVKCGFHKLTFAVMKEGKLLYLGFLAEDGLEVENLNMKVRLLKLNLIDWLGVILHLGEGVKYEVKDYYIEPLKELCKSGGVIDAILWPSYDSENYEAAEVRELVASLGPLNYRYADLGYEPNWRGILAKDHVLIDGARYWYEGSFGERERKFGFQYDEEWQLMVVLYEYVKKGPFAQSSFFEKWQLRRWLIDGSVVEELSVEEQVNWDKETPIRKPEVGELHYHHWGQHNYDIYDNRVYFSGYVELGNIEVVKGEFDALELLGEYLRVANAVVVLEGYGLRFLCRVRPEGEVERIADADGFELNIADSEPAEIRAVSLASQAIIDGLNKAYKKLAGDYPYGFTLKTNVKEFVYGEQEVMGKMWEFGGYRLLVLECGVDVVSGEVEVSGRACKLRLQE